MKRLYIILIGIIAILGSVGFVFADTGGCCFDPTDGLCWENSEQSSCDDLGGDFYSGSGCSINQCLKGCCSLITTTKYTTSTECGFLSTNYGVDLDWYSTTQEQCTEIGNNLDEGACLYVGDYENECVFTTQENCGTGDFRPGILCTAPTLNTTCEKTTTTTLVDDLDGVYFVDSCDNVANIYDSSKINDDNYWTSVKSLSESCGSGSSNADSTTCGNCDYELGSIGRKYKGTTTTNYPNLITKFLWKAESESDHNLVVLLSGGSGASIYGPDGNLIEVGNSVGPFESYGSTNRFSKPGFEYPSNSYVVSGNSACLIADTSQDRVESCTKYYPPVLTADAPVYGDYICEDLNCGFKNNGDEWCYFDNYGEYTGDVEGLMGQEDRVIGTVGSRFFRKYCLNGKVHTEGCGDLRSQSCSSGKCENNPWTTCSIVGNDTEDCSELGDYCYMWTPENTCVTTDATSTSNMLGCPGAGEPAEALMALNPGSSATQDPLIRDMDINKCLPKIPGGISFWGTETGTTTTSSYCSTTGTLNQNVKFISKGGSWYGYLDKADSDYYSNIGLLNTTYDLWKVNDADQELESIDEKSGDEWYEFSSGSSDCSYENYLIGGCQRYESFSGNDYWTPGWIEDVYQGTRTYISLDPEIIELLGYRCGAVSDCGLRKNWLGVAAGTFGIDNPSGAPSGYGEEWFWVKYSGSRKSKTLSWAGGNYGLQFPVEFDCEDFDTISGGADCKKCGADGLPCTEYRCKALGVACEHETAGGVGYCVESDDHSPPKISHTLNPPSPIPPFTAVEIKVVTDELSYCKFNIGSARGTYDELEYDLGSSWSREHITILRLPGQSFSEEENSTEHELIEDGGIYKMYVRCEDVAGNPNIDAHLISFEVDPTPDYSEPELSNFKPVSGSPITYNLTEKKISFKLDEPVECKWSRENKHFDEMENSFDCDTGVSDSGLLNGYKCEGILTNVTTNISEISEYYIRCKDQPWLEGIEDETYYRNTNTESEKYSLRASEELKIIEISPGGSIRLSAQNTSIELGAVTIGGGVYGKAVCEWKLNGPDVNMSYYQEFKNTNTSTHTQLLSNRSEGDYNISVRCEDVAGNMAEEDSTFKITVDKKAPQIIRVYHAGSSLVIITDEESLCKYVKTDKPGCLFEWNNENATQMVGAAKYHTTDWKVDEVYYIRCQDYFNNENAGCGMIVRTY